MRFSVSPSATELWSASALRSMKGSTAIRDLSSLPAPCALTAHETAHPPKTASVISARASPRRGSHHLPPPRVSLLHRSSTSLTSRLSAPCQCVAEEPCRIPSGSPAPRDASCSSFSILSILMSESRRIRAGRVSPQSWAMRQSALPRQLCQPGKTHRQGRQNDSRGHAAFE